LLVVQRSTGELSHRYVRDLPELLSPADCLVLNDTRVVPARLEGHRALTGGRWEGLFLEVDHEGHWRLLCKTRGKQRPGEVVTLVDRDAREQVRIRLIEKLSDGEWIAHPESNEPPFDLLDRVGRVPLPHYIRHGQMIDADWQNYQTVFASQPGSAAAPTAGLHFTVDLLKQIRQRGVTLCRVTLHVGLDTFRPIQTETLAEHAMHTECGRIDASEAERINACRRTGGRVVAVGTTTARVLETAAADGELTAWSGRTQLFIRPPYEFRTVDALLTNFHLPRSTLLVLVRTFGGDELVRRAYEEAIRDEYRFYSYGDAMLIV
jgi:S-adenosylmethionine:tRNA ribosyltransferase-isomerase